jgi:hypothetical protein
MARYEICPNGVQLDDLLVSGRKIVIQPLTPVDDLEPGLRITLQRVLTSEEQEEVSKGVELRSMINENDGTHLYSIFHITEEAVEYLMHLLELYFHRFEG